MTRQRQGMAAAVAAYAAWGLFPLYWPLLKPAAVGEILAHRVAWSAVVAVLLAAVWRRGPAIKAVLRSPARLGLMSLAAVLVGANWGIYIWAVNADKVVETSLGYFITPLVTIALGVVFMGERLRRAQWAAVALGLVAVVVLTVGYDTVPWTALSLAGTFATYGALKKKANVPALEGFTIETAVLFLPAVVAVTAFQATGSGTFVDRGPSHALLLAGAGLVTAVPLLCFGAAVVRMPLSLLGMVQYLAPVFQFVLGVLLFEEPMPLARWLGFLLVWAAVVVLLTDSWRQHIRHRKQTPGGIPAHVGRIAPPPRGAPGPGPGTPAAARDALLEAR